jgi:hypothetical protein
MCLSHRKVFRTLCGGRDEILLKPWDPVALAGAAAPPALVTVVASVVPSLRANVNPIDSLRAE